jgi:ribosomal protein S18 acetylase RimI-like enzyme
MNSALAQRAESCFLRTWPALREIALDGWLLRFAGGVSRRSNSVNPLRTVGGDFGPRIAQCEALYRDAGLPALFRLHDLAEPELDGTLARQGYSAEGETETRARALSAGLSEIGAAELTPRPDEAWLDALGEAQGQTAAQRATYRRIIARLDVPSRFAAVRHEGAVAAVAYGALADRLLAVESVATIPAARGRGLARQAVSGLLAWGGAQGAEAAVLQVASDNAPALRLYAGLGFETVIYRYHYRRQPSA